MKIFSFDFHLLLGYSADHPLQQNKLFLCQPTSRATYSFDLHSSYHDVDSLEEVEEHIQLHPQQIWSRTARFFLDARKYTRLQIERCCRPKARWIRPGREWVLQTLLFIITNYTTADPVDRPCHCSHSFDSYDIASWTAVELFEHLDPITATCLGLTCKKLYGIYKAVRGDRPPVSLYYESIWVPAREGKL